MVPTEKPNSTGAAGALLSLHSALCLGTGEEGPCAGPAGWPSGVGTAGAWAWRGHRWGGPALGATEGAGGGRGGGWAALERPPSLHLLGQGDTQSPPAGLGGHVDPHLPAAGTGCHTAISCHLQTIFQPHFVPRSPVHLDPAALPRSSRGAAARARCGVQPAYWGPLPAPHGDKGVRGQGTQGILGQGSGGQVTRGILGRGSEGTTTQGKYNNVGLHWRFCSRIHENAYFQFHFSSHVHRF